MKSIKNFLKIFEKELKFLMVGGSSALVDIGVLLFCNSILQIHLNLAITIAYICSACVHFNFNRHIVFKNSSMNILRSITRYIGLLIANYCLNLLLINLFVTYIRCSLIIAKIIATGICTINSYLAFNFFVFKGNHTERKTKI